jgi:ssDNA-binding Zn-finger/Zn-ribbon topoisomerase 1
MSTPETPQKPDVFDPLAVQRCPKCGGPVDYGYGLCGGGIGTYVLCDSESECDFFFKKQDETP